jgi:hypothetical protein
MSTDSTELIPQSNAELRRFVRTITNYERADVSNSELDTHIKLAKLRIKNETNSTDFFTDDGLAQAVLFTTAILVKSAVENYSVSGYIVGGQEIDVSDVSAPDSAQFQTWSTLISDGLESSAQTVRGAEGLTNTASYINGDSDYYS